MPHARSGNESRFPNRCSYGLFAVLFCSVAAGGLSADRNPPGEHRKAFECRWVEAPMVLDGEASEPAWNQADVIDDFYQPWLKDNSRPLRAKTRARLMWNREHLYFFAELEDDDLFADLQEHDSMTWLNDVCELFFKPADDQPVYYEFQVNAANTIMDMLIPARGAGDFPKLVRDGEFHVEAKVKLRGTLNQRTDRDQGWSVEGRIPWRDFLRAGGRPEPDQTWKFAVCRYDYSVNTTEPELSSCAPLQSRSVPDFHHHEDYAALRFVGPNDKTASRPFGIQRRMPLTSSKVVGSPEKPSTYRVHRVLPNLRLSWPIFAIAEPDSNRLLFIDQRTSYGKARLCRTKGNGDDGEFETLIEFDGVGYSLVFHPRFQENGYLYVGWNTPLSNKEKRKSRVTRYTMDRQPPNGLDSASAQTVIEWESDGHNGVAVTFGLDGMFYVTSGDGTSDSDTNIKGQGLDHLLAKLLRIDVDHPANGQTYSVPQDNPFVGQAGVRPETWAYGFRNPWRMTTDPVSGNIWVGNNGQDLWEQAFLVERGANYGWSVFEGSHPFYLQRQLGPTPHVPPTVEHPHSEFRSLTGGVVYHGEQFPELKGAYIYGDYSTGKVWGAKVDERRQVTWHKELVDTALQISAFVLDARGELLILDHRGNGDGGLYALELNPAATDGANAQFPRKLSDTGLYVSVAEHRLQPSLIPYSVNSPLWSDGAYKERWLALPGENPQVEVSPTRGWIFPNGTVFVKSFALELEQGKASSRRWVETRLLTRQDGEWVGYSYQWNDQQTDAELVAKEGADRQVSVSTASGARQQIWHYPSRTECMVCHSRAANYVLGASTWQLNKDHDYGGGVTDNQLRVWEHLGVLQVNWRDETIEAMRRELKASGKNDKEISEYVEKQSKNLGGSDAKRSTLLAQDPERIVRLVDPYDSRHSLDLRARSYLQANCAHCHVEAGGGNAQIDLEFHIEADKRKLFDVVPVHHTFGINDARLIAPGDPQRSVLLHRVSHRGAGQMPQVATTLVDEQAVEMLKEWIRQLK